MHRLWLKIRLPFIIMCVLIMTLFLARLFSGPEDTWIKNENGEWIKHGQPSGPPPSGDYQDPLIHLVLPVIFLASFIVPVFFLRSHRMNNRLTYELSKRDIKIMGYLSTALPLLGILIVTGLTLELGLIRPESTAGSVSSVSIQETVFNIFLIFSLTGFSGLCILCGVVFYALKRNCNDHYHLEKSYRELIEAVHLKNGEW